MLDIFAINKYELLHVVNYLSIYNIIGLQSLRSLRRHHFEMFSKITSDFPKKSIYYFLITCFTCIVMYILQLHDMELTYP